MVHTYRYIVYILILIFIGIVISVFEIPDNNLHIIACDVGQGDAILVTYKNIQILTDGGPIPSVLSCLARHMPFWDHEIELVISTHPDSDHSTGLTDVLKRYKVDKILINPNRPSTQIYKLLVKEVGSSGVGVIRPSEGMVVTLGLIHLDVVSKFDPENTNTNDNSIVYKLEFGKFLGLFTGDMSPKVSDSLASTVGPVNYIKIPHHGSANGLTENLLKKVEPKVAVISVGKKNPWGFPSQVILSMLKKYNVTILRTDLMGDVEVVTNGSSFWWKTK